MAETAPSGATDIEIPLGFSIWSILPIIAIAANAPFLVPENINRKHFKSFQYIHTYIWFIKPVINPRLDIHVGYVTYNLSSNSFRLCMHVRKLWWHHWHGMIILYCAIDVPFHLTSFFFFWERLFDIFITIYIPTK